MRERAHPPNIFCALITLDGEKEFNQNVTSCNKTLSSLKSEMGLVKAQCEGQQNSLGSLTKKHEVLTKILEEQKKKEEAALKEVNTAISKGEQNYKTAGNKIRDWETPLEIIIKVFLDIFP